MRKILLAAAAVMAAGAGAANAETTGSVGVTYSNSEYQNGYDYDQWELNGAIFHRVTGPWALQGELNLEEADYGGGNDDDGNHYAVHGLYAPDNFTVGLFIGQGELFDSSDADFWGVEGAYRFTNFTLSGSVIDGEFSNDFTRYRVGGKYFFGDNFAVNANYAATEFGSSDWETWDLGAEYRLSKLPVTIGASYVDFESDTGFEVDSWLLGARWEFGSANLREGDRTAPIADLNTFFGDVRRWD
jgi:hypothetical protein